MSFGDMKKGGEFFSCCDGEKIVLFLGDRGGHDRAPSGQKPVAKGELSTHLSDKHELRKNPLTNAKHIQSSSSIVTHANDTVFRLFRSAVSFLAHRFLAL